MTSGFGEPRGAGAGGGPAESLATTLTGFARALRAAGLPVTQDRTQTYLRAVATVGVTDRSGVYWAGRATLCADPDHVALYDRVFADWFAGVRPRLVPARSGVAGRSMPPLSDADPDGRGERGERRDVELVRARASDVDLLRHRDIAELTPAERLLLAEIFARIRPVPPRRRAVRRTAWHRGRVDARRTLREQLRRGGEPGRIRYRRPSERPRRVVLLLDVSGSMSPYADALLRLGHVWVRGAPRSTEVFTVGTRLTRVSRALRQRDPDAALRGAGEQVPDWSGGTRLGEVLRAFLDRWGQRGLARGAVVVIFSDGWERGDPALLAEQMARLARLAHRVVWVNPHRGKAGYRPVQGGIAAALPFVDDFLAGHSMATFGALVEVVGRA
ncbi:MAG TPA: VWA domain-containing protein [Kineosporiaceae bacterium]